MMIHILQLLALCWLVSLSADNQTSTLSPIYPEDDLPYSLEITLGDFVLPNGIQAFACAEHEGLWLLIAGRSNGMHGFADDHNNFPTTTQNKTVFVIDPVKKRTWTRDLDEPQSGLDVHMIDILSVTSPQDYQIGNTLYLVGGYGVDTITATFSTKDTLTAIDVPGLIHWVKHPKSSHDASRCFRKTSHPDLKVTGGFLTRGEEDTMLLIFGQNFSGYYLDNSSGRYTEQVRRFTIHDNGKDLEVVMKEPKPLERDPNYRRRDLNVVDVIEGGSKPALIAYSGVFTPSIGVWTVPVRITACGDPSMDDPENPDTFKQGMNQYTTAFTGLYSSKRKDMYSIFMGGLSYGFFSNGEFMTDDEIPFINQVTTIKCHKSKYYTQYLMNGSFPTIISHYTNPGNSLLFGTGSQFFAKPELAHYPNGVINFDKLKKGRTHLGYIVGGIQSTLPNTNTEQDSSPSAYIFNVYIIKKY